MNSSPEKIPVNVYASSEQVSKAIATEIADLIRKLAAEGKHAVLGLATGSTPKIYDELGLAEYEAIEGFVRWSPI